MYSLLCVYVVGKQARLDRIRQLYKVKISKKIPRVPADQVVATCIEENEMSLDGEMVEEEISAQPNGIQSAVCQEMEADELNANGSRNRRTTSRVLEDVESDQERETNGAFEDDDDDFENSSEEPGRCVGFFCVKKRVFTFCPFQFGRFFG